MGWGSDDDPAPPGEVIIPQGKRELSPLLLKRQTTFSLLHKENKRHDDKYGDENPSGPEHITEEAGNLDLLVLTDDLHHEVRPIAYVGVRSHTNGPDRYRFQIFHGDPYNFFGQPDP